MECIYGDGVSLALRRLALAGCKEGKAGKEDDASKRTENVAIRIDVLWKWD